MISIDGSQGEGGGQVIRSSLALSMITGKPFEVHNVRGRRKNPGLAKQHLTCVRAAATVCDADVVGAELKSSHIQFTPNSIKPGNYQFPIGTAGSTSLVAQTVLPALLTCESSSEIVVEGGTHNKMAPPFDFLKHTYLAQLNRMGPKVTADLLSYGFYPKGGGKIRLQITPPTDWKGLNLTSQSTPQPSVSAVVSGLPEHIGERECNTICRKANWPLKNSLVVVDRRPKGKGNAVFIHLTSDQLTEVFSGIGEIGVRAEQVASRVLREAREYLKSESVVGPHLADQLMLPAAIAATHGQSSSYRTMPLTQHSRTHMEIIGMFLDISIQVTEATGSCVEVSVKPMSP